MIQRIPFILFLLLVTFTGSAQTISLIEYEGWLESAFVSWQPDEEADSYHVYLRGEDLARQAIDEPLIRSYGSYFRADIPGLKAGNYVLEVVPVYKDVEGQSIATPELQVISHDRTGFAFSNNRTPGAYMADGTLKDNAVVLYLTENNKNSISLEVAGANSNPCVGIQAILEGFKKGKDMRPLNVRMIGQITDPAYTDKGDLVIENGNNATGSITFEGIGNDAVADGWGIRVKNASNIEIRNIGFMNTDSDEGDDLGLQQNNEYIWVHHCDFFYGNAGGDADQAKGDGALDCKKSTWVTFSYNHFWDTGKSNLLGLSEGSTTGWYITYHHNWYDHSDSRHPRVRYYSAHVYNNYYDGIAKYGVGATNGSSVFVEGNYFRNCKYPMLISMQGSDVYDEAANSNDYSDMPTFSKEDGGIIKAFNNFMAGEKRFVAYNDPAFPASQNDFDAFVASERENKIESTVKTVYGGNSYNNFDTNTELMYDYTAETPEAARETVIKYAGRMHGGDFTWTFNNAVDDAAYTVNTALKNALLSYQTKLEAVQGDSIPNDDDSDDPDEPVDESDMIHNFTTAGLSSSFYSISGNLSDSKGTVHYNELTLTHCLKIESATSISFTTTQEASLTLVFNEDFSGSIKINGENHQAVNGIVSITLAAGTCEISKADVANLYYIAVVYDTSSTADSKLSTLKLYPNPAGAFINISGDEELTLVTFYTMQGKLVKKITPLNRTIDITDLKAGSYLVRIESKGAISQQLIMKSRK
ncbi:pectate lyase family protein [Roseimarinus sediminis]|uniref:pectate lyase family protein n=1 Tax=Roseimarinus sediminis TaxID=1610899 RepID=UPI003D1FD58E